MDAHVSLFLLFVFLIVGFLILDLGYFNRKSHRIEFEPALWQSLFWIGTSLGFAFLVFLFLGKEPAADFLSAYVTEKMLSVDNLFVMLLLFNYFKLEDRYHHRVLFWGVMGAIFFRATFILAGSLLIRRYHWVLYLFGAVLFASGIKLLGNQKEEHVDFEHNKLMRFCRKILPVSSKPHDGQFVRRERGKWRVTSLLLIVLLVEETDIIFAFDSLPAVFSITQDVFIIFTSNIFAIMGLRSLFFLLESVLRRFRHLQKGLAGVLLFIGGKMLGEMFGLRISSLTSFAVILSILGISVLLSLILPRKRTLSLWGREIHL